MVAVELCFESERAAAHQAKRALELAGLSWSAYLVRRALR